MTVCGRSTEEIFAEHAQFKMALDVANKRMEVERRSMKTMGYMYEAARLVALDLAYKTNAPFNVDEAIKKRFDSLAAQFIK